VRSEAIEMIAAAAASTTQHRLQQQHMQFITSRLTHGVSGKQTAHNRHSFIRARCNIYISRLCYDVSVRVSVTEVHWHIIANLGFKFRSQLTVHCGCGACGCEGRDHHREEWKDHLMLC